jgi:hypothetical protein
MCKPIVEALKLKPRFALVRDDYSRMLNQLFESPGWILYYNLDLAKSEYFFVLFTFCRNKSV